MAAGMAFFTSPDADRPPISGPRRRPGTQQGQLLVTPKEKILFHQIHPLKLLANAEFLKHIGPTPDKARKAYRQMVAERRHAVTDTDLSAPNLAADQS